MAATAIVHGSIVTGSIPLSIANSTAASIASAGDSIPPTKTPILSTEAPSPKSPSRHGRLDEQARIGIGVTISVVVVALFLLALLLWRRSQKAKKANAPKAEQTTSVAAQPYLQPKAELEVEGKEKHELVADELGEASRIHEMLEESSHGLSVNTRQELRGEEHSRELEVP